MKVLLITQDSKLLYDSTWEEAIKQDDVDVAQSWENLILRLNKYYDTTANIKVIPWDDWEIRYRPYED